MRKTNTMAQDEMNEMMDNVADIISMFRERDPQALPDLTGPDRGRTLNEINDRFKAWCIDFGVSRCGTASGDLLLEKDIREVQAARRLSQHLKDDLNNCMLISSRWENPSN
jgi:hypothetical protein